MLTFAGWSVLLGWLTIQYYAVDGSPHLTRRKVQFGNIEQVLKCFIIAWSVGLVWCFALKWPVSITSLFLRRCRLEEATHVAVFLDTESNDDDGKKNPVIQNTTWGFRVLKNAFDCLFRMLSSVMSFVFSDQDRFHLKGGVYQFCRVQRQADGSPFFLFLFRRYNYDSECLAFSPGLWMVGETVGEIANPAKLTTGLSANDVDERFRVVGPNRIEMNKPGVFKFIGKELTKPFYTYQLFMIWSWFPLYYYYMALAWSFVILTSALTVALFHYRNLKTLYGITRVEGASQVLRDGEFITVDQSNLVPGDIVRLEPGITYCDMVLLTSATTVVDESALTGESNPQAKAPIDVLDDHVQYDSNLHKRHTISAGTTIVQAENSTAVVLRTGSYTAKGELLREIFAYQRHQFKFDAEVGVVIGILLIYALIGFNVVNAFIVDSAVYSWFYGM